MTKSKTRTMRDMPKNKNTPRICTLDIETSSIIGHVWSLWKQNVGLNQIHCDWSILSFTAKWLGEKKVIYKDTRGQGASLTEQMKGVRDDTTVVLALWKILDEADIVITQNGVKFDHRKINARFVQLRMPPPRPFKCIDTKLEADRIGAFTSKKLEWLAAVTTDTAKDRHTQFPGFELWIECLKDNIKAWRCMERYNRQDVVATEKLYLALRPYIRNHPNVNVYDDDTTVRCPKCGSSHVVKNGWKTTNVGRYQQYRCQECHSWIHERVLRNSSEKRKSLLGSAM